MKKVKKALSLIISLSILIITAVPFETYAASESTLRSSVVSVAEGEIGYTGTSTSSKYGDWYGYQGSWCTTFVFWCFNKAGSQNNVKLYGSIIPNGGNCNSMISWFSDKGRYHTRSSGYSPKAGDLVFFDWSGNGSSQHVGIVTGTSGSTVYTIEGNCSGQVKARTYTSGGSKPYNNISAIMGYGAPDYSSASDGSSNFGSSTARKTTSPTTVTQKRSSGSSDNNKTTKNTATSAASTASSAEETTQQDKLEALSINASTYDLQIGDTVKLNYSVEPSGTKVVVGYFCDEEGIIELGSDGDIRAVGTGTATVVVCANNELYKQCDFTVTEAAVEVTSREVSERKVVGTAAAEIVTTEKSVQSMLTDLGVNISALSQNKQLYLIPLTIAAVTLIISLFVAAAKKIKHK